MTNKKILTLISLLLFLFLMVGCILPPIINHPPEITSEAVTTETMGVAYTYDVDATDPDVGDVLTYSLTAKPDGMAIDAATGKITWTPTVTGNFDVTVKVEDEEELFDTQSFTIKVTVIVAELDHIVVLPEAMNFFVGDKPKTITSVIAHYSDGTEAKIALGACDYESSATKVATVSDVGVVTAVAEGTATITVSYREEGITKTVYVEETDIVKVTVSAVELDRIVVLPGTMTLYLGGVESAYKTIKSITAHNNDGTKFEVDFVADCTYGLNPMGIVTVTADEVTADKVGKTTLTVTYEGKTDAIEVTVLAFELDYIVVVPEEMTLNKGGAGETIESVTAHYNDESTDVITPLSNCTFKSSDEKVAEVTDMGLVTATIPAEGSGEATITVSYKEGEVTAKAFVTITVENRAPELGILPTDAAAIVGVAYTYDVDATDPDPTDVLTYFLDTFPIGMNIEPINGKINWKPVSTDSGETVTVKVGVTDGELEDTGSFDITVTGI